MVECLYLVKYYIYKDEKSDLYVTDKITIEAGIGLPNSFKTGKFKAFDTITLKRKELKERRER